MYIGISTMLIHLQVQNANIILKLRRADMRKEERFESSQECLSMRAEINLLLELNGEGVGVTQCIATNITHHFHARRNLTKIQQEI